MDRSRWAEGKRAGGGVIMNYTVEFRGPVETTFIRARSEEEARRFFALAFKGCEIVSIKQE